MGLLKAVPFLLVLVEPAVFLKVFWNTPSYRCPAKYGVDLGLDDMGIIHNNGELLDPEAKGDKVVIFYKSDIGLYYTDPVNGNEGCIIPQCKSMTEHLAKVENDINEKIPYDKFDGIAVIDWEEWRFSYRTNWGEKEKYREASRKYVRDQNPHITNETKIEEMAQESFDEAAKNFILRTIDKAKAMRPKAKWGFYLYPECYSARKHGHCADASFDVLPRESAFYDASIAMYPSIYFKDKTKDVTSSTKRNMISAKIELALQARGTRKIPIYVYTKLTYDSDAEEPDLLSKEDLCHQFALPFSYGVNGFVIWSTGTGFKSKDNCKAYRKYIRYQFKPFMKALRRKASECSEPKPFGCRFKVSCGPDGTTFLP